MTRHPASTTICALLPAGATSADHHRYLGSPLTICSALLRLDYHTLPQPALHRVLERPEETSLPPRAGPSRAGRPRATGQAPRRLAQRSAGRVDGLTLSLKPAKLPLIFDASAWERRDPLACCARLRGRLPLPRMRIRIRSPAVGPLASLEEGGAGGGGSPRLLARDRLAQVENSTAGRRVRCTDVPRGSRAVHTNGHLPRYWFAGEAPMAAGGDLLAAQRTCGCDLLALFALQVEARRPRPPCAARLGPSTSCAWASRTPAAHRRTEVSLHTAPALRPLLHAGHRVIAPRRTQMLAVCYGPRPGSVKSQQSTRLAPRHHPAPPDPPSTSSAPRPHACVVDSPALLASPAGGAPVQGTGPVFTISLHSGPRPGSRFLSAGGTFAASHLHHVLASASKSFLSMSSRRSSVGGDDSFLAGFLAPPFRRRLHAVLHARSMPQTDAPGSVTAAVSPVQKLLMGSFSTILYHSFVTVLPRLRPSRCGRSVFCDLDDVRALGPAPRRWC